MPDRLQQEIEELLAKLDTFPPRRPLARRLADVASAPFRGLRRATANVRLPHLSAGHVLLIAIAVIVVAYLGLPGGGLSRWVIALAIVIFIAAFVMSLGRQSRPPEKYWRDRPMDLRSPSAGDRFKWWRRRPRR